jgi:hypothetical protein
VRPNAAAAHPQAAATEPARRAAERVIHPTINRRIDRCFN